MVVKNNSSAVHVLVRRRKGGCAEKELAGARSRTSRLICYLF